MHCKKAYKNAIIPNSMENLNVSLIIPSYNEEKRILSTIRSYISTLDRLNEKYEIIVSCNGCTDNTAQIVRNIKNPNIKVIESKLSGKGVGVVNGFKIAKGKYIGFLDADNPFDLNTIMELLKNNQSDGIIISKWLNKSFFKIKEPFLKKFLSRGWNLLSRILLGLTYADTQAGAKFFKKEVIDSIDKSFICKGFEFDVELLYKIKKKGFKIKEVPMSLNETEGTTFRIRYILSMFNKLAKLWQIKHKK